MAGEKEAETVGRAVWQGGDGLASEVAADVVGELGGGLVAILGVAAKGFEDDGVEVALEFPSECGWGGLAGGADDRRVFGDSAGPVGVGGFDDAGEGG